MNAQRPDTKRPAPFAQAIGRTRFVVLLAVAAVLLAAMALFVVGAVQAVAAVGTAAQAALRGDIGSTKLTVQLLEIVSAMLKAVVFYIVGVGLYSLFIAPLNLTAALGLETLNDLESKVVSVLILIMAITFLEHFIAWQQPAELLQFAVALALVVATLVLFQFHSSRAQQEQQRDGADTQVRARQELFQDDQEERRVRPPEAAGARRADGREAA
jgi:uncharacterized membrane protein YqhA